MWSPLHATAIEDRRLSGPVCVVLYRRSERDDEVAAGPRRRCEHAWQWAVDASPRRGHLRPPRPLQAARHSVRDLILSLDLHATQLETDWYLWQYCTHHTHIHPFNGPFSRTTWVSWYQKGKTNLDFTEARDSEWQWHQLGHMQVCTSLQTDNHASTRQVSFLQAGCPSCHPTNSVKALKATYCTHHIRHF